MRRLTEVLRRRLVAGQEEPPPDVYGRLVLAAKPNGVETLRGWMRSGSLLVIGMAVTAILAAFLPVISSWVFIAGIGASVVAQLLVGGMQRPFDLHFYEGGLHGSLAPDNGSRWSLPRKRLIPYEEAVSMHLDHRGNLVVVLRDPRTLQTQSLTGLVPPSRLYLVEEVLALVRGNPRKAHLPDTDPREFYSPRRVGW